MKTTAAAIAPPPWIDRFAANAPAVKDLLRAAANNNFSDADAYLLDDLCDCSGCRDDGVITLLVAALIALREGSVCLELSEAELRRRLECLVPAETLPNLIAAALASIETAKRADLIGDGTTSTPLVLRTLDQRSLLYFQKYLRHERRLEELLLQRLSYKEAPPKVESLKAAMDAVLTACNDMHRALNDEQKLACALSLLRHTVVVTGGPGTGKTSVVMAILGCHLRLGIGPEQIALACPTGRAAQRLTESLRSGTAPDAALTSLSARTLHRLLGYSPGTGRFRHHRENPLPHALVVIDETSMLDVVLMSRLLEALSPETRLVLLGDSDQLPSVDAGSVLADLVPRSTSFSAGICQSVQALAGLALKPTESSSNLRDTVAVLKTNYRSDLHIQSVAGRIITCTPQDAAPLIADLPLPAGEGGDSLFDQNPGWPESFQREGGTGDAGCWLVPASDDDMPGVIAGWTKRAYERAENFMKAAVRLCAPAPDIDGDELLPYAAFFRIVSGARVLTLVRDGPSGCVSINARIASILRGRRVSPVGRPQLFVGAPVLITANDYSRDLFNGDVGVCLRARDGSLRAVFARTDEHGRERYVTFAADTLSGCELAFAMTVHKSQGSEFGEVLLALPSQGAMALLNRQMIYTAITRARRLAVICGETEVLKTALSRGVERRSGMVL